MRADWGFRIARLAVAAAALGLSAVLLPSAAHADSGDTIQLPSDLAQQTTPQQTPAGGAQTSGLVDAPTPGSSFQSSIAAYFENWFVRSDAAKAAQPHWLTPLVTVTPRLEQEYRYDQVWQQLGNGNDRSVYNNGKGLELIPDYTNEILLNPPPYIVQNGHGPATGYGDWGFLTIKQRLLTGNEQNGNYIVTAFLGFLAPAGNTAFTANAWQITPTIAGGKGWGDFDIQSTLGLTVPTTNTHIIGDSLAWNTTFQYHVATYFWPEFETNYTHWLNGVRGGKDQLFLTPGILLGRFPLYERYLLSIGGGYQWAATPKLIKEPLTPLYSNAWILTARVSF